MTVGQATAADGSAMICHLNANCFSFKVLTSSIFSYISHFALGNVIRALNTGNKSLQLGKESDINVLKLEMLTYNLQASR